MAKTVSLRSRLIVFKTRHVLSRRGRRARNSLRRKRCPYRISRDSILAEVSQRDFWVTVVNVASWPGWKRRLVCETLGSRFVSAGAENIPVGVSRSPEADVTQEWGYTPPASTFTGGFSWVKYNLGLIDAWGFPRKTNPVPTKIDNVPLHIREHYSANCYCHTCKPSDVEAYGHTWLCPKCGEQQGKVLYTSHTGRLCVTCKFWDSLQGSGGVVPKYDHYNRTEHGDEADSRSEAEFYAELDRINEVEPSDDGFWSDGEM